ncbi:MAG TPA: hypothetical protein DEQ20_02900 [Desulfobulbaceae bacterium]|nr:MAG: hypothetical protein A2520_05350 [Deltaproteobacteria bacterium RIFOXYD12_FULL_53_23]HCC53862.1 hypothetical protein [Desulfobulbaceae bacterium]
MTIACGIDIGTNSFRLLVAEIHNGCLLPLAHDLTTVRLGEDLELTGLLAPAALLRAEAALIRFAEKMAAYPMHSVRACATHAVRKASNSQAFLQQAEALTGLSIEVLSGEEEAHLALLGVLSALPGEKRRYPLFLVDVGGGSSELIIQATAESDTWAISLPLGAVGLTEEFGMNHEAMREKIRAILAPALQRITKGERLRPDLSLIASGGTATSLAALALGLNRYDAQQVQNYHLSQAELHRLVTWLTSLAPEKRNALTCLTDRRGEIIVAGAVLLQELQQALAISMLVSNAGLLEGILLSGATSC